MRLIINIIINLDNGFEIIRGKGRMGRVVPYTILTTI